jgi:predicted transcriptional regulator
MDNSRKFAIEILKELEKVFPEDMVTAGSGFNFYGEFDQRAIKTLIDNGLIEEKEYPVKVAERSTKAIVYKITSKGIEFLNNLEQKKTNKLIIILTLLTVGIGLLQIGLMIFNK